jgi:hypothetical protein
VVSSASASSASAPSACASSSAAFSSTPAPSVCVASTSDRSASFVKANCYWLPAETSVALSCAGELSARVPEVPLFENSHRLTPEDVTYISIGAGILGTGGGGSPWGRLTWLYCWQEFESDGRALIHVVAVRVVLGAAALPERTHPPTKHDYWFPSCAVGVAFFSSPPPLLLLFSLLLLRLLPI